MQWNPTQYFDTTSTPSPFALLILNQPINERAFSVLRRHGMSSIHTYMQTCIHNKTLG
jgi:thiamine pyrophosphokinase